MHFHSHILKELFIYIYLLVEAHAPVCVFTGQLEGAGSHLPQRFQGLNSVGQPWQQVPFDEPSYQPSIYVCDKLKSRFQEIRTALQVHRNPNPCFPNCLWVQRTTAKSAITLGLMPRPLWGIRHQGFSYALLHSGFFLVLQRVTTIRIKQ